MSEKSVATKIDGSPIEYVDIEVFGYKFKEILPGNAEDLVTLEKEGAIYVHHYDEKSGKFNYYRIKFLPKEIFEYAKWNKSIIPFDRLKSRE